MGQAKQRKATDPLYGKVPQGNRSNGLVISPPVTISGTSIHLKSTNLDPQELRFSLLFWDRLVWPSSRAVYIAGGPDADFLEDAGILSRPDYTNYGDVASGIKLGFFQALKDLDRAEPGRWALSQGENSLLIQDPDIVPEGGAIISLCRAIPVPQRDVPLAEILEFKERRGGELLILRHKLDSFVERITKAENKDAETARCVKEIEQACSDLMAVGREWQLPFQLSDFSATFSADVVRMLEGATAATGLSTLLATGIPLGAAAAAGAAGSLIKLERSIKFRSIRAPLSPFRYSYLAHKELI